MRENRHISRFKEKLMHPIFAFLFVVVLFTALYANYTMRTVEQKRERARAVANSQTSAIKDRLDLIFARDYAIRDVILSHDGDVEGFNKVAQIIFDEAVSSGGVPLKNIAVAPGGVVSSVYPMEGNESLLGFNFLDAALAGNSGAVEAYEKGRLVVTDPFELVQGGEGIGARLPVYFNEDGQRIFWGLVTITLDYEELLRELNLSTLKRSGYEYRLWYEENGEQKTLTSSGHSMINTVNQDFEVCNLTWNLEIAPETGWYSYTEAIVAAGLILAFAFMMAALQSEQEGLSRANEKLSRLAHLDALSGCYTRQYVNNMLVDQKNGAWTDPDARYSLAMVDVDDFKTINDTFGHEIGDRAIAAVAEVLCRTCKQENGDCVIRHGGDEFVALYNDVSPVRFEEKLRQIVEEARRIRMPEVPDFRVTVSVGGAAYKDKESSSYYLQIHTADKKLYEAKEQGRDQYRL